MQDVHDGQSEAFDEEHILWGTKVEEQSNGFSLVADGQQGLHHAVPLDLAPLNIPHRERYHPLRLRLRHYLNYDSNGSVSVTMSRLVALRYQPEGKRNES
jgi:CRISPR-associated protein (TIGR03984 family)